MGDAHVVIVDHHRVQIGGRAITAQNDHVVQFGIGDAHLALHQIVQHGFALTRGAQAKGGSDAGGGLGGITVTPAPVIAGRAMLGDGALAHLGQFLRRAITWVGHAVGQQFPRDFLMARDAGGLIDGRRIGGECQPFQPAEDHLGCLRGGARAVGVLDPQQELAAMVAGEQIVEQRRAGAANVQHAGGRRGEAGTDGHARDLKFPGRRAKGFPWP